MKIPVKDWDDFQKNRSANHPLAGFQYDLEYYLAHGFMKVTEAFEEIESQWE